MLGQKMQTEDPILTNDTKVVLTGITDLYTKWFASQTQIHRKLNIEKDEIFTYSTTDAPLTYSG